MNTYGKKQQQERLALAHKLFLRGCDIPSTKKLTGLTLAAMRRAGQIFEIVIPDPKGYKGGHPITGEGAVHNGHMLHTDKWRPVIQ